MRRRHEGPRHVGGGEQARDLATIRWGERREDLVEDEQAGAHPRSLGCEALGQCDPPRFDLDDGHAVATGAHRTHLRQQVLSIALAGDDGEVDVLLERAVVVVLGPAARTAVAVVAGHHLVAAGE